MIWKLSGTDRTAQTMQAQFMDVTTQLCAFGKVLFGQLFNTHFIDQTEEILTLLFFRNCEETKTEIYF
jgi:hypothetical protein